MSSSALAAQPPITRARTSVTHVRSRINNVVWEKRLGISTRGMVAVDHFDSMPYGTMSYHLVWPVLNHLNLGPSDTFVDVGCGKGRVLCCAARYGVERVDGVDFDASFCDAARVNAQRMKGRRAPISVLTGTADKFDYSDTTVLFFFNPFGAATMAPLLEQIASQATRSLRIAYGQPTADEVFKQQSWLEQTDYWDATEVDPAVSFYRSR